MKSKLKIKHVLLLLICTLGMFILSCEFTQTDQGGTPDLGSEEVVLAQCNPAWFPHNQTPKPAEGKGSHFDTTSTTNSIFQEWAWQKFLYLTKAQPNGMPLFLNEYIKIDDNMNPIGTGRDPLILEYTAQAGPDGVLMSNARFNARNGTPVTVYYSLHINDELHVAADLFREELVTGKLPLNNNKTFPVSSEELKVSWVDINAIPISEVAFVV